MILTRRASFIQAAVIFIYFYSFVAANFAISAPDIPIDNFVYQGNASIEASGITLTWGQRFTSSIVYWNTSQTISYGFRSSVLYQNFDCDTYSIYLGGDGFTFFFTSSINTTQGVSFGSSMGVANKTNTAFIGFDFWQGRIVGKAVGNSEIGFGDYIVKTATILESSRCTPDSYLFQIEYIPPTLMITANTSISIETSITMDLTYLGSDIYVGLSGSTGEAFMRQEITQWDFIALSGVVPILECYEQLDNGSYFAHMGYENSNSNSMTISIGAQNAFAPGSQYRGQLVAFQGGRSAFYPLNAFSFPWDGSELTWNLSNRFVTFNGNNPAHLCPTSLRFSIVFSTSQSLLNNQINAMTQSIANLMGISLTRVNFENITYVATVQKRDINAGGYDATLELEIGATDQQTQNEPSAAQSVQTFVESAANTTLINQVLNPDGGNTVEYLSSSTKPSGSEGTGSLLIIPTPIQPPVQQSTEPIAEPTVVASNSRLLTPLTMMLLVFSCIVFAI